MAKQHLRIEPLLDPEDVHTNKPDKKSILMYVMCLYRAIESISALQLRNATSMQLLDQHFEGSAEDINLPSCSSSAAQQQSKTNIPLKEKSEPETLENCDESQIENLTDLDEISLAKSIEDLSSFPVPNIQRSSTFTITKNELINLSSAADGENQSNFNTNNEKAGTSGASSNFQTLIETHSRPVSTAEIGGYQNAIEIVLSLLLEAEEILSKPMPEISELLEAKSQFQSHEEFMIKLAEYQEYVGGALEEGARLLSEPTCNTGLTVEDQSEIKQQMLLLNERWELLRISALDIQSRVHSKLAQVQMQKIEDLRILLTNTEDHISRMAEIDPNPDAIQQQINEHKALEASLNDQKILVDDLSNLVVIVNDESFNDLEDKLTALGERWTHVVKWTKNRFLKLQNAHLNWKFLNRRLSIASEWLNVRENDLKQMESRDISAIGSVMKRMQDLRFCAMDLNVLRDNLSRLEELAQSLQPASSKMLEKLEYLQDRCDALKEIVEVQQQRIEGMGFDFNVDILDNVILPNGWNDFQSKYSADYRLSTEIVDTDNESNQEESPQSNKKRKLHRSENSQKLDNQIRDMTDFVCAGEQTLTDLKDIATLKDQRKALETLQSQLRQKITVYPEAKTLLSECSETNNVDLTEQATEISNIGTKYDELSFRIEHLIELNEKASVKEKFLRNLTGLKLVLADCQDWFKQCANLNVSTQEELENRLAYMESLSGEIDESQQFYENVEDKNELKEWKVDFDQFHHSWIDIKNAIKRLLNENFEMEQIDDNSEIMEETKSAEYLSNEVNETIVVFANLNKMNENLKRINELQSIVHEVTENEDMQANAIEFEKWQKLASILEERHAKQLTAIDDVNHFTKEFVRITEFLTNLEQAFTDDIFILGEEDDLKKQSESYEANGMEIKKVEIDIISMKNFSEVIVRESTDDEYKAELLEKIQMLNDLYSGVKKIYQTNSKALKQATEQSTGILKRIIDIENWLVELEKATPSIRNAEIKTSNELFQIRNKFQSLKEMCEKKTVEFRELNEAGNEIILRIDEQLNKPNCQRKFSTLARQFTRLNAKWNDVTTLVYNRTALLEHISSQLGELKTLIVSECGYLDKLEKCLRKSPENAADAEEIYEELDVSKYIIHFYHIICSSFNFNFIAIF